MKLAYFNGKRIYNIMEKTLKNVFILMILCIGRREIKHTCVNFNLMFYCLRIINSIIGYRYLLILRRYKIFPVFINT